MALSIASQAPDYTPIYGTEEFAVLLESHLTYLKNLSSVVVRTVTAQQGAKFRGDFYGLLKSMQVQENLHYLTLRINNLFSPEDYQGDQLNILIPPAEKLGLLGNIANTTTKKST